MTESKRKPKKPCGNCEQFGNTVCAVCLPKQRKPSKITDKERLDWLESLPCLDLTKWKGSYQPIVHTYERGSFQGRNVRYAIDRAILRLRAERKERHK